MLLMVIGECLYLFLSKVGESGDLPLDVKIIIAIPTLITVIKKSFGLVVIVGIYRIL